MTRTTTCSATGTAPSRGRGSWGWTRGSRDSGRGTSVKAEIARGQPVIAAIQFKKGEMPSAVFGSTNGHLIVIRGFTPGGT